MPKVSVIIPVYNVEKYLGECLDSILGQTLKDIEVLCVDDGSTDDSAKILADYAARDARVKVFASPHAGAFRAREVGVKAATGEYAYFMDADDRLNSVAFEELCALSDRENLDQVVFTSSVVFDKGYAKGKKGMMKAFERYYSMAPSVCEKAMSGMELMSALQEHNSFHVSPPLRLTRMSVIRDNEYGFPDATSRADNYFTPISLYYSRRAMALDRKYYIRRLPRFASSSRLPRSFSTRTRSFRISSRSLPTRPARTGRGSCRGRLAFAFLAKSCRPRRRHCVQCS